MSFRELIKSKLLENRPNLSAGSVKTYVSILTNLHNKVFNSEEESLTNFLNKRKVMEYLENIEGSKRKTILASLVVLLGDQVPLEYQTTMSADSKEYKEQEARQEKTEKQEENWIEQDELNEKINQFETNAKRLMKNKDSIGMNELQEIQQYILLCLVSGKYIPVRRSLDWTEMKLKNSTDQDNEIQFGRGKNSNKFIFRRYKTDKVFGVQEVIIPTELKKILMKWVEILNRVCPDNEYLLVDSKCQKLIPVKITQRLNKIFGKSASINILRHSYVSERTKNIPSLTELEEDAVGMGHGLREHLCYAKK